MDKRKVADRLSDLRQVDPHTTALANGYRDDTLVSPTFIYPIRRVLKEAGRYTSWGPTPHIPIATFNRALGTKRLRIDVGHGGGKYTIAHYEVEVPILRREIDNVIEDNRETFLRAKSLRGERVVQLGMEVEIANHLQNGANHDAAYVEVLAGGNQWADQVNSNPIAKLRPKIRKVRLSVGMQTPVGVWFGSRPFEAFTDHPKVLSRAVGATGDEPDEARIAKMLGVQRVGLLAASYAETIDEQDPDSNVFAELWGDVVIIAPLAPATDDGNPDFPLPGAIVRHGESGVVVEEYDDPTVQGGPANVKVTKDSWGITQISRKRMAILLDASGVPL